jgi:hypothetical protein
VLNAAPLFQQRMPKTRAPLSVKMSNAGDHGWVTPFPHDLLTIWAVTGSYDSHPSKKRRGVLRLMEKDL